MNKWAEILESSYEECVAFDSCIGSRLEYLSAMVFEFATYDEYIDKFFAEKALDVCEAISNSKTFEYIEDDDDYKWYIAMCNMPFFANKIEWGTSIRGAWWDGGGIELNSCGIMIDGEQETEIKFTADEWSEFIACVIAFGRRQRDE